MAIIAKRWSLLDSSPWIEEEVLLFASMLAIAAPALPSAETSARVPVDAVKGLHRYSQRSFYPGYLGPYPDPDDLTGMEIIDLGSMPILLQARRARSEAVSDANSVTISDYVENTLAQVDFIREVTNAGCIWLVGHSEAGLVALVQLKRN